MSKLYQALRGVTPERWSEIVSRFDTWVNNVTGFGTSRDKTTYGAILPSRMLSDQELADLYHSDDMAARMVNVVPEEMFREPFTVETGDPGLDEVIADKFEHLDVRTHLMEGMRWGRCFGGAAVLIGADDGQDASQPLIPERAKDLSFLYVIDRRLLWPISYYTTSGHPKLGKPDVYQVTVVGGTTYNTSAVHESRLLIFRGAPTGIREQTYIMGWDFSYLQRAYEILRQFATGWKAVETLLTDSNQAVFSMTGLSEMIGSGKEELAKKRVQIMDLYRSVMRAIVIDADAKETFERQALSIEGIPNTLDKFMLRLAAAVEMPVTMLMGQSPAGMNATGESDFRWFYDRIRSKQNTTVTPIVRRLTSIYLRSKASPVRAKKMPKSINVDYPALWTETPLVSAQRELAISQRDAAYVQAQVLIPEEVALHRFRPKGFDKEIQLTDEAVKAREKALTDDLDRLESGEPAEDDAEDGGPSGAPFGGGAEKPDSPFPPAQKKASPDENKTSPKDGAADEEDKPTDRLDADAPRTFELVRHVDETGVSGTGSIAEGVVFGDGSVVLKWKTATSSTTFFKSTDEMLKVHGHGGKTELRFFETARLDGGDDDLERDEHGRFAPKAGGGDDAAAEKESAVTPADAKLGGEVRTVEAKEFSEKFEQAFANSPMSAFVTHYSEEQLGEMKCLLSRDGNVGIAVKDHGDGRIEGTALFNQGGPPGAGHAMLAHAVANAGVNYLECFGERLAGIYEKAGFKVESRSPFDDRYAPKNWNYSAHGRPDYFTLKLADK